MVEASLLSVFLVGLLGGLHCAGMCGGIVAVMGSGAARGRPVPVPVSAHGARARRRFAAAPVLLGYNLGRVASYTIAGAAAGAVGSAAFLARDVLPVQRAGFLVANCVLIAMGLYLTGVLKPLAALEAAGGPLWRVLRPLASRTLSADRFATAVAAGLVWGWVPCGMVYAVLVAALASGSAAGGAALALAFGLGTLPNLLALGWTANAAGRWLDRRAVRVAAGLIVIGFGVAGLAKVNVMTHLNQFIDFCITRG
jgi:uncharacterized protein